MDSVKITISVWVLVGLVGVGQAVWGAAKSAKRKWQFPSGVTQSIQAVLADAVQLQDAYIEAKSSEMVVAPTQILIRALRKSANAVHQQVNQQRSTGAQETQFRNESRHLILILQSAKRTFEESVTVSELEKRKQLFSIGIRQLTQVAQVFEVPDFVVYFCPSDRSTWLSKSKDKKGFKHPLAPDKKVRCRAIKK